jgi:hypothetical protein
MTSMCLLKMTNDIVFVCVFFFFFFASGNFMMGD